MPTAMSTAISNALTLIIKYWYVWLIVGAIVFIVIYLIKRKRDEQFKPFIPTPQKKTLNERLGDKMDMIGQDFNGSLYVSMKKIANIWRYYKSNSSLPYEIYDPKTKDIEVSEDEEKYKLLVLEKVSRIPLFKYLGIWTRYIILERKDKDGKDMFKIDEPNKNIFLFEGTDLLSYASVWVNTDAGMEYLNNISASRRLESANMHIENLPDKFAHLEMEQAKKERINKILTELEKSKYKDRESAGDTTIV